MARRRSCLKLTSLQDTAYVYEPATPEPGNGFFYQTKTKL